MPPSASYAAQHTQQPFPALYLYPLNDSFIPKHISLLAGQRVKIGRQTNPKTAPGEKNGFFDSKVLSRQHAEIWEDSGKILIKDVKSSNGTFINGERLSPEGVESVSCELKSDDIVEFGIDIVGEDNKTIIHHKVAARAVCVFSEQDAQVAARAEQHQQQQQQQQHLLQQQQQHQQPYPHALMGAAQPGPNMPSQFNFVGAPQQRRPAPNVGQGIAGIGGMGGSMRPPGKSGLTFEHILSRLQGELQKSRETGSELHSLNGSMSDIHQVLGGNISANIPPYPAALPPVRPVRQSSPAQSQQEHQTAPSSTSPPPPEQPSQLQQQSSPQSEQPPPSSMPPNSTAVISQLQSQLLDTQTLLTKQADKVRALEEVVADQELMRKEVRDLRQLFETRSREIMFEGDDEDGQHQQQENSNGLLEPRGGFDDHDDDDDIQHIRMLDEVDDDEDVDDTRSVHTIVPHELESVEEEDEEDVAEAERDHHPRIDEVDYAYDRADPIDPEREREDESGKHADDEHEVDHEHHHQMRKHENLNVGRPRTPEPSFGLREQPASSNEITVDTKAPSLSFNSNGTAPAMVNSPRARSGTLLAPRSPLSSPLSQPSETIPSSSSINGIVNGDGNDKMLEQMLQLSAQMTAMAELAGNMEAQYVAARDMIKVLEGKVGDLERMVREEKEKEKEKEEPEVVVAEPEPVVLEKLQNIDDEERKSLTSFFAEFKKSFDGEWNEVKEEWREERERLKRAREEWESKSKSLDVNLEKVSQLNVTTSNLVKDVQGQKTELMRLQERVVMKQQQQFTSGEVVRSGLVTPPSPRSQSSASAGEEEEDAASGPNSKGDRRRRRRRSGSQRGINVIRRNLDHYMMDDEEAALSDGATLASEGTGSLEKVLAFAKDETITAEKRLRKSFAGSSLKNNRDYASLSGSIFASDDDEEDEEGRLRRRRNGTAQQQRDMLPTPASMMTSLSLVDEDDEDEDGGDGRVGERKKAEEEYNHPPVRVNLQTAGAVIVLAVAAAAVFWKVKSE